MEGEGWGEGVGARELRNHKTFRGEEAEIERGRVLGGYIGLVD